MTLRQKDGDSALPAIVSVSLNGSAGGRSSADDWEGGSLVKIYICSQPTATTTTTTNATTNIAGAALRNASIRGILSSVC